MENCYTPRSLLPPFNRKEKNDPSHKTLGSLILSWICNIIICYLFSALIAKHKEDMNCKDSSIETLQIR